MTIDRFKLLANGFVKICSIAHAAVLDYQQKVEPQNYQGKYCIKA